MNFITRRDLEGLELGGNYTFIKDSAGDYDLSAAYGWQMDRGNALVVASYRRRSELRTTDRDWALRPFLSNFFGGWSTASNPGVFQTGTAAEMAAGNAPQSFLDNGCTQFGGFPASATNPAAGCRFQYTQFDNLVNDEFHYHLYGEVNVDLTDDVELHLEALWARHDVPEERVSPAQSTTQFPTPIMASGGSPGGGVSPFPAIGFNQQSRFYVPATNPGLIAFLANPANCPALGSICTNAAANGVVTSQTLWRPQANGGNQLYSADDGAQHQQRMAETFRIAGELKGHIFNDIGWNLGLTYHEAHGHTDTPDISVNRLQYALLGLGGPGCNPTTGTPGVGPCRYFNPFANAYPGNPATGATNPFFTTAATNDRELVQWMHQRLVTDIDTKLLTADAVFNGELPLELGGGAVGWALGAQWRYDSYEVRTPTNYDIAATPCVDSIPYGDGTPVCSGGVGPFTFYPGLDNYQVDRVVSAAFGEVKLPITDTFELSGALRYEYYGGNFGSTTNPKVSARWQVVPWMAVRASAGTTFRAPSQTIITPGSSRILAQFNLPGVGNLYRPVDIANNPQLEPETADTFNLGLIFSAGNLRATVDYFKFKFKDELTTETAASVVATMFPSATPSTWRCGLAGFRDRFTFVDDGNPATDDCTPANLLGVRTNQINGPDVDTSGVDFQISYFWPEALMGGDITLGGDGTYTIEYKRDALLTLDGIQIAAPIDRAGKAELLSAFYSYPKWRVNAYVNWSSGPHNLRWTVHFKDGPTNIIAGQPDLKMSDELVHDLVYVGEMPWGAQLTVAINNVFDEDPPFTRSQYNYDYTNGFFLGRTVQVGVKKKF